MTQKGLTLLVVTLAAAAVCVQGADEDECLVHGYICTDAAQICSDRDVDILNTWLCLCVPPATGAPTTMQPAVCKYPPGDCETNGDICNGAGQSCIESTPLDGLFQCACLAPAVGTPGDNQPAVCILDECTAQCPTCADKGLGNLCDVAGQHCVESSTSPANLEDWMCKCVGDAVGESVASVAVCTLDECKMNNGRLAKLCDASAQTCNDPNKAVIGGLDDWECVCPPPTIGRGTGKLATCVRDECLESDVAVVCTSAGQTCQDPNTDTRSTGDWTCSCAKGDVPNVATGQAATCVAPVSWCVQHGDMCTSQGQACIPAANIQDAGSCACIAPQTGLTKVGAATVCILDECTAMCATCADHGAGNVCTKAGQTCTEGSTNPVTGTRDWRCKCAVSDASAVAAVAVCTVNECDTDPKAKVCTAAEQTCTDKNTAEDSLGDWMCTCYAPSTGSKMLGAADCSFDECLLNGVTCEGMGQECVDPDMRVEKSGDWVCQCIAPASGKAVVGPASCLLDECNVYGGKCTVAGQLCIDHNTAPASLGDWTCNCPAPAVGVSYGGPASCTYIGACKVAMNFNVCADAGQRCISGDSADDFTCACMPPYHGTAGERAPAQCVIDAQDECLDIQNLQTCRDKGQECVDLHPGDTSLNDWECHCVSPSLGSAIGHAAVCKINECLTYAHMQLCHDHGQTCFDPDTTAESRDDWMCRCAIHAVGSAVMKPAQCVFVGECAKPEIAAVCTDVGQTCIDTDVVQDNTWVCLCVAPETGVNGIMGPAQCGSHYTTDVPETQLPVYTTDSPTQLPVGTTDLPETQLPVGTTRAPESQLPDNTTDAPETQLPPGKTLSPDTQVPFTAVPSAVLTATPGDAMLNDTDRPAVGAANTSGDTAAPTAQPTTVPDTSPPAGSMSGSAAGAGEELDAESDGGGSAVGLIVGVVGGVLCLCAAVGGGLWYRHHVSESSKFAEVRAPEIPMTFDDTALYDFGGDKELQAAEEDEHALL